MRKLLLTLYLFKMIFCLDGLVAVVLTFFKFQCNKNYENVIYF